MESQFIEIEVRAVIPTSGGSAVFVGNEDKVFVIYVDQMVGAAITMFQRGIPKERPQTHDLLANILLALGAKVERVIINDLKDRIYFARLIIVAENEISERKIVEIDARPSDSIAIATQQKAPIYISSAVWEEVEDMSEVLRQIEEGSGSMTEEPDDMDEEEA